MVEPELKSKSEEGRERQPSDKVGAHGKQCHPCKTCKDGHPTAS